MKLPLTRLQTRLLFPGALLTTLLVVPVKVPIGDDNHVPDGRRASSVVPVHAQGEAVQRFIAGGKSIQFVQIDVAEPPKTKRGALHLSIARVSGSRLQHLKTLALPTKLLRENTLHQYRFRDAPEVRPGETLALVFRADATKEDPVLLRVNPAFTAPDTQLTVGGQSVPGSLEVSVRYWRPRRALARVLPKVWSRVTVFHGPFGKTLLVLGLTLTVVGFASLIMRPTRDQPK